MAGWCCTVHRHLLDRRVLLLGLHICQHLRPHWYGFLSLCFEFCKSLLWREHTSSDAFDPRVGWLSVVELSTPILRAKTASLATVFQSCILILFVRDSSLFLLRFLRSSRLTDCHASRAIQSHSCFQTKGWDGVQRSVSSTAAALLFS